MWIFNLSVLRLPVHDESHAWHLNRTWQMERIKLKKKSPTPMYALQCWGTSGASVVKCKKSQMVNSEKWQQLFQVALCGRQGNAAVDRVSPMLLEGQQTKWKQKVINKLEEGVDRNPLMSNLQRILWKLNMDQLEYHLILESHLKQKTNVISRFDVLCDVPCT
jgi:hypothetical protein